MILFRLNPSNKLLLMSVNAMLSPGNKSNFRQKVSLSTASYYRKLYSESLKGRKLSKEHVESIRKRAIGKHPSKETREKMSDNSKSKVKVIDPNGVIYDSINSCSKNYGVDRSTLRKWIKKKPEKGFKYYLE